jgi:NADPH2:quinone reductase
VWGSNQGLLGRQGTFAEYAAVDEKWLYLTPPGMSDIEAAAGALVGITAHLGLFQFGRLKADEVLFVNGGTGGVGHAVVQMGRSIGAKVVTTVGSEEKKKRAREYGADLVLDYHSPRLDDEIGEFAKPSGGVNVWYETQRQPTLERTIGLMARRGRIILMAGREARPEFPLGKFYTNDLSLHGFAMFNAAPEEQAVCADAINRLYLAGGWKPNVGKVLPLSEAAAAHRLQEENTLGGKGTLSGKIVLTP